jgi:hypothetical protein
VAGSSSRRLWLIAAVTVAAVGLLPVTARATTFCVPGFDPERCPNNGTNVAKAILETAMQSEAADGEPDTVIVAPGTYIDPDTFEPTGVDPLTIEGSGAGEAADPQATRLTTGSSANVFVVDLAASPARPIVMRDLTVVVPASLPDNEGGGIQVGGDTLEGVDVEVANPHSSAIPSWPGGGTYEGGRIYATGGGVVERAIDTGASGLAGQLEIADVTLVEPTLGIWAESSTIPVSARRVTVERSLQGAFLASQGGQLDVVNSVAISGPATTAMDALANTAADTAIEANHLTLVHEGSPSGSTAVSSRSSSTGNARVTLENSILRGYAHPYGRTAFSSGVADLTVRYSNLGGEVVADAGPGTLDAGTGNIDAEPLFAGTAPYSSATDLALLPGSASVDAGDPAPGGEPADFLGAARPLDGDGDGIAVRDQGAFELTSQLVAGGPQPTVTPPPGKTDGVVAVRVLGKRISFSSRGIGRLRLRCPTSEANPPCRGKLVVRTRAKLRLGGGKKAKRHRLVLVKVGFKVGKGRTKAVPLKLKRAKLRLLLNSRRARRLVAVAKARDGAGNRATVRHRLRALFRRSRGAKG